MKNREPKSKAFKIVIATAVLHFLAACAALAFFVVMRTVAASVVNDLPFLFIIAIFLAFLAVAGVFVAILQTLGGIGIIIAGVFRKSILCVVLCSILIVVDAITAFCSAMLAFAILAVGEFDLAVILYELDLLLMAALSIAGAVLSVTAIIKNLSERSKSTIK